MKKNDIQASIVMNIEALSWLLKNSFILYSTGHFPDTRAGSINWRSLYTAQISDTLIIDQAF